MNGITKYSKGECSIYPFQNKDLPLDERVNDLISRMTIEEKISLIPTRQAAIERLGIKEYRVGGEAAHGLVSRDGPATVFPQTIGLSCSWDTDLLHQVGCITGDEARAYYRKTGEVGGLTRWAPTVDMERDPRWGRTEESYGEDPYLTGEMSSALIRGMQGDHPFYIKTAAALKHFFANNNEDDRLTCSASVDPRNMKEYYWSPFRHSIEKVHTCCMMTAYNSINGRPAILNSDVLDVVKGQWGLPGFVVADGGDFSMTVTRHKYYDNHAESIAETLKSGVDCIPDDPQLIMDALREALDRGLMTEEDLDNALRNIFRIRFRLGQFDNESDNPYSNVPESVICCPRHISMARRAVRESIVLLKNEDQMLPLKADKLKKVAVIGPLANVVYRDWYTGIPPYVVTPLQTIKERLKDSDVTYSDGRDEIIISSAGNGKYLSSDPSTGYVLMADKYTANEAEVFKIEDWGWGRYTLESNSTGKFVTTGESNGQLSVTANEVWGWFVRELYDFVPESGKHGTDNTYSIKSWDYKPVIMNTRENGLLKAVSGTAAESATEQNTEVDAEKDSSDYTVNAVNAVNAEISRLKIDKVKDGIKEAVEAAKAAETAIVFLGNHPLVNGKEEIDRPDITLAPHQEELLKAVFEANPNTILVLSCSYPYAINWANENMPAIVYLAQGGQEAGNGIADVLFGDYNPAGRLNMTWYKSASELPDIMDYDIIKGKRTYQYYEGTPLYPFGYGLSYTSFQYSDLSFDRDRLDMESRLAVSCKVTNIGGMDGDEVVQLYVRCDKSRVKRPVKQLKGFRRIHLKAGETQTVRFRLFARDLEFWDVTREKYCIESGTYTIMVGASSQDIRMSSVIAVEGETIPPRDLTVMTKAENYDDYDGVYLDESIETRTCVRPCANESWLLFKGWDKGTGSLSHFAGPYSFEARVSGAGDGGTIEIRLGSPQGQLLGTLNVPDTGGRQSWQTLNCGISGDIGEASDTSGDACVHDICLVLKGDISLSWFRFL